MVKEENFLDFSGEKEEEIQGKPQVKLFKKGDVFYGYIKSISDNPLAEAEDNGMGGITFGNKVFTLVAIGDKSVDHKSSDGTATGDAEPNEIIAGEEYNFFTNYSKKGMLNVNGAKLSAIPLGGVVKLENMGKKKSEKSNFSYKVISIMGKKDNNGKYVIHPDYKAVDDFNGAEEISVSDTPF